MNLIKKVRLDAKLFIRKLVLSTHERKYNTNFVLSLGFYNEVQSNSEMAYCPTVSQSVKIFAFGYMMYVYLSFLLTDSQKPRKQSAILIHSCPLVTVPATVLA